MPLVIFCTASSRSFAAAAFGVSFGVWPFFFQKHHALMISCDTTHSFQRLRMWKPYRLCVTFSVANMRKTTRGTLRKGQWVSSRDSRRAKLGHWALLTRSLYQFCVSSKFEGICIGIDTNANEAEDSLVGQESVEEENLTQEQPVRAIQIERMCLLV